jgi:hypothetical protein
MHEHNGCSGPPEADVLATCSRYHRRVAAAVSDALVAAGADCARHLIA